MMIKTFHYKKGNRAYEVSEIQFLLVVYHQIPARELIPDGFYGTKTMVAVARFQRKEGLEITGECDSLTWEKLREKTGRK